MSQYIDGTVTVTNGDATVVGSGTLFSANVTAGDLFTIQGSSVPYIVGSVTDNTNLELTAVYAGSSDSGLEYAITTSFTPTLGIPYMEQQDLDTATIFKRAMLDIEALLTGNKSFNATISGTITTTGNVGVGVTPDTCSTGKQITVGQKGNNVWGYTSGEISLVQGMYYNSGWKHGNSTVAPCNLTLNSGAFYFQNAAIGTMDAAVSGPNNILTLAATGKITSVCSDAESAIFGSTQASGGFIRLRRSSTDYGAIGSASQLISGGATDDLGIRSDGTAINLAVSSTSCGKFDTVFAASLDSSLALHIRDVATAARVSAGASDSGGSGYRLLRVPN